MAYTYKKEIFYTVQSVCGAGLFLLGVLLMFFTDSKTAGFAMVSGGGICCSGMLCLLVVHFTSSQKEADRESIESKDERNKVIRNKSAWATHRVMLIVLSALAVLVTFILPYNLVNIVAVWSLLFINGYLPYVFSYIFSKRF
ncbi:MAG: hypothetical protein ACRC3H_05705 [Lachnospiraceae bacterium]